MKKYQIFVFRCGIRHLIGSSGRELNILTKMYMMWGQQYAAEKRTSYPSAIMKKKNGSETAYVPVTYYDNWYQNGWLISYFAPVESAEHYKTQLKQNYWAASFLLPLGSILVLAFVVMLMVLFQRYPQIISGVVGAILGTIIIFVILVSMNHLPVYT